MFDARVRRGKPVRELGAGVPHRPGRPLLRSAGHSCGGNSSSPGVAQRRRRVGISTLATARCMSARAALVDAVVPATRGRLNDTSSTPMATAVQNVRAGEVNFSSTTKEPKPSNEPVKLPITTSSIPMMFVVSSRHAQNRSRTRGYLAVGQMFCRFVEKHTRWVDATPSSRCYTQLKAARPPLLTSVRQLFDRAKLC